MSIITEIDWTCISSTIMWSKLFRFYTTEVSSFVFINAYLIIWGLSCKILPSGMYSSSSYSMHFGIWYIFSNYRNSILPYKKFFIISSAHKFILLDKIDGIDCSCMLTVLKLFSSRSDVKLQNFSIIWSN